MKRFLSVAIGTLALAGCASELPKNMPLIFGESITVGISMGASAADNGGDFTLGFKSKDIAIIPVVAYDKDGNPVRLQATVSDTAGGQAGDHGAKNNARPFGESGGTTINKDSYSVLGQFSTTADGSGRRVGLGKFFATGAAAQQLSHGFAACIADDNCGKQQDAAAKK